jgi:PAS domain S-box-containing protein
MSTHGSTVAVADQFRLLIEAVDEYAMFMLDADGIVRTWNKGARRIKGYTADEIVGRHFSVFYRPDDVAAKKPQRELDIAAEAGVYREEGWRVRKDGSQFWANVVLTAVHGDDGQLLGFAKVTRDDTDRVAAAERNRQLDQLHDRERIAHDVTDSIVRQLFQVGLMLDSVQQLVEGSTGDRIAETTRLLDQTIANIREVLLPTRDVPWGGD